MNREQNDDEDSKVRPLLHQWILGLPLPPRFQEQVWQRIERQEPASRRHNGLQALWVMWLSTWLPRPAFATVYLGLLLALGGGIGWAHARQESSRMIGELSSLYVRSVDPYHTTP